MKGRTLGGPRDTLHSKNVMIEIEFASSLVDLPQVYFQTSTKKRQPKPKQNESEDLFCMGPADRFLAVPCVCRGLVGNRLVASLQAWSI